jgi:hypothetical protein
MGLKGYGLWVMGHMNNATCGAPPLMLHGVAAHVAFERQTLKPVFSLDRL